MYPIVIQQKDGFSLEVVLNDYLRNYLLEDKSIIGDFVWNNLVNNPIHLRLDSFSVYSCSRNYYELTLTSYQLNNPEKNLSYTSNSIFLDTNRGNPLKIRILEDYQFLQQN